MNFPENNQRIAELEKLADRNNYRELLENLPQKIFHKDKNSVYVSCNNNYARDLKIQPYEIIGKTDYDFYTKELAEKYRATALKEQVAKALYNKGFRLGVLNRNEDAISTYDEVVRRFGDSTETVIKEQVAKALVNKGVILGAFNRDEDAFSVYDEIVRRFGDSTETAIKEQVAKARINIL